LKEAQPGDRLNAFVISGSPRPRFFDDQGNELQVAEGREFHFTGSGEKFTHKGDAYTDSKGGQHPYLTGYIIIIL
jgi:hypothetical protein